MTLQEVITKAIEGGFSSQVAIEHVEDLKSHKTLTIHDYGWVFVREDFWQSLGKAMGWNVSEPQVTRSKVGIEGGEFKGYVHNGYVVHWIDFVEHLAEGKDAESFFESLTN